MSATVQAPPDVSIADATRRVRSGESSALELTDAYLSRIAAYDEPLNIYRTVMADRARDRAREIDEQVRAGTDPGPLAGVPIALKDNIEVAGVRMTASTGFMRDNVAKVRCAGDDRARASRRGDPRQAAHVRVGDRRHDPEHPFRCRPQPLGPRSGAGWLQRRIRGRDRRRRGDGDARNRHRRIDPAARLAVRRGRAAPHEGTGQQPRIGPGGGDVRHDRTAGQARRGCRGRAGGDRRL